MQPQDVSGVRAMWALRQLGLTPEEIAHTLMHSRTFGKRGSDSDNPLARFLKGKFGIVCAVHADHVDIQREAGMRQLCLLSPPCQQFLADFHAGTYPKMEDVPA